MRRSGSPGFLEPFCIRELGGACPPSVPLVPAYQPEAPRQHVGIERHSHRAGLPLGLTSFTEVYLY